MVVRIKFHTICSFEQRGRVRPVRVPLSSEPACVYVNHVTYNLECDCC